MKETWIMGINVTDRMKEVNSVQSVLAKFGCSIRTRLGLNTTGSDLKPGSGLIILELYGDSNEYYKLENELLKIEGIEVKKMIFKQE
jgi:hypothetical protein